MKFKTAVLVLGFGFFCLTLCQAGNEILTLDKAPVEIQEAIRKLAGEGKILLLHKTEDKDGIRYEAVIQKGDGPKIEHILNQDGSLNSTREYILWENLKGKAAETARAAVEGGKVQSVDRVIADGKVTYEIRYQFVADEKLAVVAFDGTLIKNVVVKE